MYIVCVRPTFWRMEEYTLSMAGKKCTHAHTAHINTLTVRGSAAQTLVARLLCGVCHPERRRQLRWFGDDDTAKECIMGVCVCVC